MNALSAASYLDPARIDYTRPNAATQLELIDCFKNGNCVQDDKIRIYPMPCNGSGTEDCTGCYVMRSGSPVRVGDLNSNGTCSGIGSDSDAKIRVFVGYERKCPNGSPSCLGDGQIFLSCSITSEGSANEFNYNKECFSGTPYIRRVKVAAPTITVIPSSAPTGQLGCDAGYMGIYPSCVPCSDNSYKPTIGNGACTVCALPTIQNSENLTVSTAGTTKTSMNDCRVNFSCTSGYIPNLVTRTCYAAPGVGPSATPSPGPSSNPSPNPTPSYVPVCEDANMVLTVTNIKPAGPTNDEGIINLRLTWNPIFAPEDYVVVYGYRMNGAVKQYVEIENGTNFGQLFQQYNNSKMIYFGQGAGSAGVNGDLQAGDYFLTPIFTLNGNRCPMIPPNIFTVPVN